MTAPLTPHASLLVKLGSMIVHYEEMTSPDGHAFDQSVIEALRNDPEVEEWFNEMREAALLPVKRRQ